MLSALVRNTRLSWAAAVAVVLAVTTFALSMGQRYLEASYWAAHSVALRDALESTLAAMTEAEAAERGFLLTGDDSFLVPYFDARPALRSRLLALRTLTGGDAAQQARLDEAERLVYDELDLLDASVGRWRDGPGGVDVARLDRGRDQMARLRAQINDLAADEQRRLDAHAREADLARDRTERALAVGALLIVGIALGAFARMRSDSRRLAEAADSLAFSEARLRRLAEAAFEGIVVSEGDRIVDGNAALAFMFGYGQGELPGFDALGLVAAEDRARLKAYLDRGGEGVYECRGQRRGGETFPIEVRGRALPWGDRAARVTAVRDITERKRAEDELVRRAERLRALSLGDELTGLANRRGFLELARERLAEADRTRLPAALFFIDLNGMKPINDRLGHEAGDRLLADAAMLLRGSFRGSDVLARLGGDEFVVLAPAAGPAEIGPLESRLRAGVAAFNERGERPYRVSMSIGCSIYDPASPLGIEQLLAEADEKMYARKRARQASGAASMMPVRGEAGPSGFPTRPDTGAPSAFERLEADAPPAAAAHVGALLSALPTRFEAPRSAFPTRDDESPSFFPAPAAPEPRLAVPPASGVIKAGAKAAGPGKQADAPPSNAAADARRGTAIGRIAVGPPAPRRPSSGRA